MMEDRKKNENSSTSATSKKSSLVIAEKPEYESIDAEMEQGKKEILKEIATSLKRYKIDYNRIKLLTGLSLEEIEEL